VTIPFVCLLVAFLLIPLSKAPVAVAMGREKEGYDNKNPRDQQARLTGWGRRALGAHHNTIEAFPGFAAGVLAAHAGGASPSTANALAVTFVVARVIYPALYIANVDKARSLVWTVGFLATVGLLAAPLLR